MKHSDEFLYHIRGKITKCCLAETEGIFFLITRVVLVIKRARLVDPDWLTVSYLEQAKLHENLLPDSDSDEAVFFPSHIKYILSAISDSNDLSVLSSLLFVAALVNGLL